MRLGADGTIFLSARLSRGGRRLWTEKQTWMCVHGGVPGGSLNFFFFFTIMRRWASWRFPPDRVTDESN